MANVKNIQEIAYHRNGISGEGFYAVRFTADIEGIGKKEAAFWNVPAEPTQADANFLAILFDGPGQCAVICTDRIATHGVKFAGGNSWRGDHYEDELRAAIEALDGNTSGGIRVGPFCVPN